MEYTKSIDKDGEVFESFTGTPEEIARLIIILDGKVMIHPADALKDNGVKRKGVSR